MTIQPGRRTSSAPSPSERALFDLWDLIDRVRAARGEQAAYALAQRALEAVKPSGGIGKDIGLERGKISM